MKPVCFLLISTLFTLNCYSQQITLSRYSISSLSTYSVVGSVGNNIIVWSIVNDRKRSEIIVYDNNLRFIRKVSSGILKTFIDPHPTFFNNGDSFYVAYQSRTGNAWKYKLACFDDGGNMLSDITIDSLNIKKSINDTTFYYYRFLQSPDKNKICFAKLTYNSKNFILNLECSFASKSEITHKKFVLPFDISKEYLNEILIDNSENLFFAIDHQSENTSTIKIVKKVYNDDYMLVVQKQINTGTLIPETIHLSAGDKNNYILYGVVKLIVKNPVDSSSPQNGVYTFNFDSALNNYASDTTFVDSAITGLNDVNIKLIGSINQKQSLFIIEKKVPSKININTGSPYPIKQQLVNNFTEFNLEKEAKIGILVGTGHGSPSPAGLSNPTYQPYNNIYYFDSSLNNIVAKSEAINYMLVNVDELNNIKWVRNFNTLQNENSAGTYFSDGIVVTDKNNAHVIYPIIDAKLNFIKHLVIDPEGNTSDKLAFTWNSSYNYMINEATSLGHYEILFPIYKSGKIRFAKMNIK